MQAVIRKPCYHGKPSRNRSLGPGTPTDVGFGRVGSVTDEELGVSVNQTPVTVLKSCGKARTMEHCLLTALGAPWLQACQINVFLRAGRLGKCKIFWPC